MSVSSFSGSRSYLSGRVYSRVIQRVVILLPDLNNVMRPLWSLFSSSDCCSKYSPGDMYKFATTRYDTSTCFAVLHTSAEMFTSSPGTSMIVCIFQ
ncbi:hypothetical protein AHF37_09456 [Paragonimus kellicotti]|nr:hypothetical protein AHF37_09456 [Paragonimus kellicotti]